MQAAEKAPGQTAHYAASCNEISLRGDVIMQNKMISETKNGKTVNIWLECLFFILIYLVLDAAKGVFVSVPLVIEMIKTNFLELFVGGIIGVNDILEIINDLMASPSVVITMLFSCALSIIGVIIYCRKIQKRSFTSMGITKKGAIKNYLIGMLIGAALLIVIYIIYFILGVARDISYSGFSYFIPLFFFGFAIQSTSEEFLLRGYLMNSLAARSNIPVAVILNSAIFMVIHLLNPGVTIISMVNILIFGLLFSLMFLLTENIWMVSGLHFFWNFASGCIFGSNVSGIRTESLFSIPLTGSELVAGGEFGVEGSIVTTVIGAVSVLALLLLLFNKSRPEHQQADMY